MKKCLGMISYLAVFLFLVTTANAGNYTGKKVLFIDSYHEGYAWSGGITKAVKEVIEDAGAQLSIQGMDTKRNTSDEFLKEAGQKVKAASRHSSRM